MKPRTGKVRQNVKQRKRQRRLLMWQQGPWCCICGRLIPKGDASLEHKIPFAEGGRNHVHNLGLAHRKCNNEKPQVVDTFR